MAMELLLVLIGRNWVLGGCHFIPTGDGSISLWKEPVHNFVTPLNICYILKKNSPNEAMKIYNPSPQSKFGLKYLYMDE